MPRRFRFTPHSQNDVDADGVPDVIDGGGVVDAGVDQDRDGCTDAPDVTYPDQDSDGIPDINDVCRPGYISVSNDDDDPVDAGVDFDCDGGTDAPDTTYYPDREVDVIVTEHPDQDLDGIPDSIDICPSGIPDAGKCK